MIPSTSNFFKNLPEVKNNCLPFERNFKNFRKSKNRDFAGHPRLDPILRSVINKNLQQNEKCKTK